MGRQRMKMALWKEWTQIQKYIWEDMEERRWLCYVRERMDTDTRESHAKTEKKGFFREQTPVEMSMDEDTTIYYSNEAYTHLLRYHPIEEAQHQMSKTNNEEEGKHSTRHVATQL